MILAILLLCFSWQPLAAQEIRRASQKQAAQMISLINRTSARIQTIHCNFTQTSDLSFMDEKAVSRGHMDFDAAGSLTWQYTSPYKYTFSIANGKVTTQSGSRKQSIDLKSNRMFGNIAEMMMNSVSGKCLSGGRDFHADMYVRGNEWIAYLKPLRPDMKKMFRTIRIHFSRIRRMVQEVEMIQGNGDHIDIALSDIKVTYRK